jgi:hypothetical protein
MSDEQSKSDTPEPSDEPPVDPDAQIKTDYLNYVKLMSEFNAEMKRNEKQE